MTVLENVETADEVGDFGLAEHLAAIERMHAEALAELDALVQPWGHLWAATPAVSPATEEMPVVDQPMVPATA